MVAHFFPEFVQSFKGNLLYFLLSVRKVPISNKLYAKIFVIANIVKFSASIV